MWSDTPSHGEDESSRYRCSFDYKVVLGTKLKDPNVMEYNKNYLNYLKLNLISIVCCQPAVYLVIRKTRKYIHGARTSLSLKPVRYIYVFSIILLNVYGKTSSRYARQCTGRNGKYNP